jgi:hypothetical protein
VGRGFFHGSIVQEGTGIARDFWLQKGASTFAEATADKEGAARPAANQKSEKSGQKNKPQNFSASIFLTSHSTIESWLDRVWPYH